MFKIVVLDRTAESRNRIIQEIYAILSEGGREFHFIPRLSLKPLTSEELKFHADPDICIVGEEIVQEDITEVARIRKLIPNATLIVKVSKEWGNLAAIEQLARMGVDDILTEDITSKSFLQKLILLTQKVVKEHHGKLIPVSGGKGGTGVTSIAVGLAESLFDLGKKVVLVDFDYETQDLSRFVQARPFVNENLQLLIDHNYPVTEESVRECLVQIWADEPNFLVMPPFPETRDIQENVSKMIRILLSVFEQLDSIADCIVVDAGAASGALLEMLYRVADRVVYPVTNDPAAMYASVERVKKIKSLLGETASFALIQNNVSPLGLTGKVLIEEFNRATDLDSSSWASDSLPFCKQAARWPGSGASMVAQGSASIKDGFLGLLAKLELVEESLIKEKEKKRGFLPRLLKVVSSVNNKAIAAKKMRDTIIAGGGAEVKQLGAPEEKSSPQTTEQRPILGTKHVLRIADKGSDTPIKSETRFEEGRVKSESREDSVVTTLPIPIKREVEDLEPPKRLVSGARVI